MVDVSDSCNMIYYSLFLLGNLRFKLGPIATMVTKVTNSMDLQDVQIPVLLPHEVLHALQHAGETQAKGQNDKSLYWLVYWL